MMMRGWVMTSGAYRMPPAVVSGEIDDGGLLDGETQGFAIDATTIGNALYVGGPDGGDVQVVDTTTPANDLDHVPLDASNLTQSGTSAKLVQWSEAPYVRWTPHNMLLQSQTFGTTWSTTGTVTANTSVSPDGTTTGDTLESTSSGDYRVTQDVTTIVGNVYTLSVYAKQGTEDWIAVYLGNTTITEYAGSYFDLANGVAGSSFNATMTLISKNITSVGSGWYRIDVTAAATQTTTRCFLQIAEADNDGTCAAAGDTIILWGAQLVRGYNANPYLVTTTTARIGIPQEYDTYEELYGVLVEPAATNLKTYSEQLNNGSGWATNAATVTANDSTAPDGSTTAEKLTANAGVNTHVLYQSPSSPVSGTTTHSIYIKDSTARYVYLTGTAGGTNWYTAVYDLTTETVTASAAGAGGTFASATINSVGGGWYRITATGDNGSSTTLIVIGFSNSATPTISGGDVSYNAAGTEVIYLWGAQVEAGTTATSYIPTLGSTVTRAADVTTVPTSSFPYDKTKWTLYLDFKHRDVTADRYFWELYDGVDERYQLHTSPYTFDSTGVATGVSINTGVANVADTRVQITCAFAVNDADASVDGGSVVSDGSCSVPTDGATTLYFFHSHNSDAHPNGYIYRFVFVPRQVETEG